MYSQLLMIQRVNIVLDIGLHLWATVLWLSFILRRKLDLTGSQGSDQRGDEAIDQVWYRLIILNRLPCS